MLISTSNSTPRLSARQAKDQLPPPNAAMLVRLVVAGLIVLFVLVSLAYAAVGSHRAG
jgi:hypothetical protein